MVMHDHDMIVVSQIFYLDVLKCLRDGDQWEMAWKMEVRFMDAASQQCTNSLGTLH